jgi:outer membrane lipoprotein-sorting protein
LPDIRLSRRALLARTGSTLALAAASTLALPLARAFAKTAKPIALSDADKADVKRIEDYLNGITTMRAKFQQASANQQIVFGDIYVRRPGFLRVQYDPPSQVILVADSIAVSYYDAELNQLNQAPLSASPLWFLLRKHVELGGDVTITSFQRGPNVFQIGLVQTDEPDAGVVTLVLGDKPLELQQWTIVDSKNQQVRVALYNAEFGIPLENSLFRTPEKKKNPKAN